MEDLFTSIIQDDTISILTDMEDTEMLAKYHDNNSIYLYGVFSDITANRLINFNFQEIDKLNLYETPDIAIKMAANQSNAKILRFAVYSQKFSKEEVYYDAFTMDAEYIKKQYGLTLKEAITKAHFIRKPAKLNNSTLNIVEYIIKSQNHISSIQYI